MDKLIETLKLANKHMASDTIVNALAMLWANKDNVFCKQATELLLDKLKTRQLLRSVCNEMGVMQRNYTRKGTYGHKMGSNYFQKSDLLKKKIPDYEHLETEEKKLRLDLDQCTKALDRLIEQKLSIQEQNT